MNYGKSTKLVICMLALNIEMLTKHACYNFQGPDSSYHTTKARFSMTDKGFSLINLGDISQPVTKLIESVANAIGILYEPTRIRKIAKAEADAAIIKAKGKIEIKKLSDRATNRRNYIEARRQKNIESIVEIALTQLPETVDETPVDEDWIIQFFNLSQDIGNEKMQTLWGRLLAGEVAKPNSFSLRTLNLIRMLSQKDAEMIEKATNYLSNGFYLFFPDQTQEYLKTVGLGYYEMLNLSTLGVFSNQSNLSLEPSKTYNFRYFDKEFSITIPEKKEDELTPLYWVSALVPTVVGQEVLSLCNPKPDYDYWKLLQDDITNVVKSWNEEK